ncbi:MAG: Holliday junction branch migration protein RuvA [Anaerolineales bacterium]
MIATLRGKVTQVEENALIIEVGGVGLRVFVPRPLLGQVRSGDGLLLYTHLVVRDDALALYGFESPAEREAFTLLLSVEGIGPKTALSLLSSLSIETLRRAIGEKEPELLARVPGIGSKTAQRIVLALQDRFKASDALAQIAALSDVDSEVLAALTALGYSVVEAQTALQSLPPNAPPDVEERLRLALQYFQR